MNAVDVTWHPSIMFSSGVSHYVSEYPSVGTTDLILCLHCELLCVSGCDFTCGCLLQARDPVMIRIILCLFNWWLLLWIVFSVHILKACLGSTLSLKPYCISPMLVSLLSLCCFQHLSSHVVFQALFAGRCLKGSLWNRRMEFKHGTFHFLTSQTTSLVLLTLSCCLLCAVIVWVCEGRSYTLNKDTGLTYIT